MSDCGAPYPSADAEIEAPASVWLPLPFAVLAVWVGTAYLTMMVAAWGVAVSGAKG